MLLKNKYWYSLLLTFSVACYSAGLYQWSGNTDIWEHQDFLKAVSHGFIIGLIYFTIGNNHVLESSWLHKIHFLAPVAFYLKAYQSSLPFLWFWSLLLLQFIFLVTYEWGIAWRRIPIVKNLLIAAMWFVQLNFIPALAGAAGLLYFPFFLFYLALSIQVDIEDIEVDSGKIKTFASLVGRVNAGYVVLFLLTLFSFLIGLPWVWIMIVLIVIQREISLPKNSYDSLLFLLGLYFLLR
jgi:hypothetical protein